MVNNLFLEEATSIMSFRAAAVLPAELVLIAANSLTHTDSRSWATIAWMTSRRVAWTWAFIRIRLTIHSNGSTGTAGHKVRDTAPTGATLRNRQDWAMTSCQLSSSTTISGFGPGSFFSFTCFLPEDGSLVTSCMLHSRQFWASTILLFGSTPPASCCSSTHRDCSSTSGFSIQLGDWLSRPSSSRSDISGSVFHFWTSLLFHSSVFGTLTTS